MIFEQQFYLFNHLCVFFVKVQVIDPFLKIGGVFFIV